MIRLIACAGASLLACTHSPRAPAADDPAPAPRVGASADAPAITVTHVAGPVHMIEGRGGNIGVSVGADGKLMIDDQFAPLAPAIEQAIDRLGDGPLRLLVNTHFHGDHTGGNPIFGKRALIVAHDNVRKRLAAPQPRGDAVQPAMAPEGLPVVTFAESVTLHFNGEPIRVIHLPHGHTDGDSIVYFTGSHVIHMGDHYFNGRFPFIDLAAGGDVVQYTANVAKVIEMLPPDAKVIPGHGPLSDVAGLRAFHAMLVATTAAIRAQMQQGKRPDQIVLDPKWASWGQGFVPTDRWIATVYESLQRSAAQ